MKKEYQKDIDEILSHRYDNGCDFWTTQDKRLLKGAPFTTLESVSYLLELGVSPQNEVIKSVAELIFSVYNNDGRFKIYPTGGIYPCHSAHALQVLCKMGYVYEQRVQTSFQYFLDTQEDDGGWKCCKYSFGRGAETNYSTPYTTLVVLDAFRYRDDVNEIDDLDKAVDFLLGHWIIKKPISPCHYGIGKLFMQIEYPFRGYNLFYFVYVLSFYEVARNDSRFFEAFHALESQLVDGQIVVKRVVPKLAKLSFCEKGKSSVIATQRYQDILMNLRGEYNE